jgi:hypothetical protein
MVPEGSDSYFEFGKSGVEDPDNQLLYHYTAAGTALEEVLVKRTLRFSPSLSMSDPLEHSPPAVIVTDRSGNPLRGELADDVNHTLNELRAHMSQLSLTMDATGHSPPLGRGYARARMWDRYGVEHSGVCLCFSAAAIVDQFLESARGFGVVNARWVDYDDSAAGAGPVTLEVAGLDEQNYSRVFTDFVMDNEGELFFTKLLEWETEFEYRLLMAGTEKDAPVYVPFGQALRGIILGERFDPDRVGKVLELGIEHQVRVMRLRWRGGIPSVEPLDQGS